MNGYATSTPFKLHGEGVISVKPGKPRKRRLVGDEEDRLLEAADSEPICPFDPASRRWDMLGRNRYDVVPEQAAAVVGRAKAAVLLNGFVGSDDLGGVRGARMEYLTGCPAHLHADMEIESAGFTSTGWPPRSSGRAGVSLKSGSSWTALGRLDLEWHVAAADAQ